MRGYQYGQPDAFRSFLANSSLTVDDIYVDGVSITHGNNPRLHVWTHAIGFEDGGTSGLECPCNAGSTLNPPSFVGENY